MMTKINKILLILVFISGISLGQDEIRKLSNGFSHGVEDNKIHFTLDEYEIIDEVFYIVSIESYHLV